MPNNNVIDSDSVLIRFEEEREKLRKFASKITKVPESVRIYSTPNFTKSEDQ